MTTYPKKLPSTLHQELEEECTLQVEVVVEDLPVAEMVEVEMPLEVVVVEVVVACEDQREVVEAVEELHWVEAEVVEVVEVDKSHLAVEEAVVEVVVVLEQ